MKIVILGAGQVGYNLARYLATEENDVTIVDKSADLLRSISDNLDIKPVVGYASHPEILHQAGLNEADLLIAVTASDEINMVACEVANALFKVKTKIARIRTQDYLIYKGTKLFNSEHLAVDYIISPEVEVAHSINRSIRVKGAFNVISLLKDQLRMVGIRCSHTAPILNTPLRLLPGLFPKLDFLIVCIERKGQRFIPGDEDQLSIEDKVFFITTSDQISNTLHCFGISPSSNGRVLIMGAGSIGLALALELENSYSHAHIKIIEKNKQRAEYIAHHLKKTDVLWGDVLDINLLKEANIESTDTVISVTQDDKVNILASLLAKQNGAERTMTLLNNMDYSPLIMSLGIDSVICPHDITVSSILQYVRRGQIHAAHALQDGSVEIIEAEPKENSNILGLTVEDINIKGKIKIAALIRADQIYLSPLKTSIRIGDRLVLIVLKEAIYKIERLFSIRPKFCEPV